MFIELTMAESSHKICVNSSQIKIIQTVSDEAKAHILRSKGQIIAASDKFPNNPTAVVMVNNQAKEMIIVRESYEDIKKQLCGGAHE